MWHDCKGRLGCDVFNVIRAMFVESESNLGSPRYPRQTERPFNQHECNDPTGRTFPQAPPVYPRNYEGECKRPPAGNLASGRCVSCFLDFWVVVWVGPEPAGTVCIILD